MDTSEIYSFTNGYSGPSQVLAASSTSIGAAIELLLLPAGASFVPSATAAWTLSQAFADPSAGTVFYRLHTVAGGRDKALDVINTDGTASINLQMAATAEVSGQLWRFDAWPLGGYRLSNNFTGVDMHLDVYSDTLVPHLADGDHTGQHWTLNTAPAGWEASRAPNQASAAVSTATPTSTLTSTSSLAPVSTPASTAPPASPSPSSSDNSSGGSTLSTGTIAGVSVGGALGAVALIAALSFLLLWYLRRQRAAAVNDNGQQKTSAGDAKVRDTDLQVGGNVLMRPVYAELGSGEPVQRRSELL